MAAGSTSAPASRRRRSGRAAASRPPATRMPAPRSTPAPTPSSATGSRRPTTRCRRSCASSAPPAASPSSIDGKNRPFGVLDVHATEPHRFSAKDVPFVQAAANVLADAIERHNADQALRYRVLHDALTGLPNRLSFVDSLGESLAKAAISGSPVGILFLDLDHFKLINDSLGHHAGDALLRAVAPRLRSHLRPGDIVARFGGDEFGVLIDRLADEGEAMAIADRVAAAFAQPFAIDGVEHFVSASIGIAVAGGSGKRPVNAELLIRDADAAMYRAKESGRSRCVLFDAEMRAAAMQRLEVERELRQALERDELALHYQPVVNLRSGEINGLEALVRWRHPERGLLDPGEFVSIAEDSGLIEPIGRWVQERACRQALDLAAAAPRCAAPRRRRQPLRPPGGPPGPAGGGRGGARPHRPRPGPPPARDHRERPHRGVGDGDRLPAGAERARRAPGPRRFRHRLLLARLPQPLPVRRAEDRPLVRRCAGDRAGGDGDRRGDHRHGARRSRSK